MKKIKTSFNQKDRVVCVSVPGAHEFYYQPYRAKARTFLFKTDFSGSVWAFFRDKGRNMDDRGFSLTLNQIYEFKAYHNIKLARIINRIPVIVDYILREKHAERAFEKAAGIISGELFTFDNNDDLKYAA